VGSSNNAAVENISGDLPKVEKLGSHWQGSEYLKPVAYKVAAQQDDGSFKKLGDTDQPWGLISCALGNSNNRTRFKERFCYMEVPKDRKPSWQIPDRPQNIREWIDNYRGPDFAAAKRHFKQKDEEVEKTCARMKSLADLLPDRLDSAHEEKISLARRSLEACRNENSRCQREKQDLAAAIERLRNSLDNLKEDERLLNLSRPEWWARIRRTPVAKRNKLQLSENASAQLRLRRELSESKAKLDVELHSRLAALSSNLSRLEDELKRAKSEKKADDERFEAAESEFASLPLPKKLDDLHAEDFQKSSLWHLDVLAQQRSELFAAALSLHEAWLASVGKRKAGFRQNILAIADVLSGRRLENPSDALSIWQSLFLIVPIVSTTFASFHNQFADLRSASLGWLFIDEAGQAVPQAAVGAIWCAKHAVVIGDPLQIEPVFTLPSCFIATVAELSPHTADGSYSPHKTSVQRLADNGNKFGVTMRSEGGQGLWVGSPLRVHRRCIEPMFSWSNEIAYDGKMVFGLPSRCKPNGPPISCESAWIDIRGNVRKRQEVAEQTQFVLELLAALYQKDRQLPGLYLISPFKAIKTELIKKILNLDWVNQKQEIDQPRKSELKKWCKERVGTVHTFQGKEEDTVLMILGADSQHAGSADWACAKPNIWNVAITRARRRFYMVGDRELWGARGPFAWSADRLLTMNARQFLAIARNGSVLGKPTAS
jgi:AAA domain